MAETEFREIIDLPDLFTHEGVFYGPGKSVVTDERIYKDLVEAKARFSVLDEKETERRNRELSQEEVTIDEEPRSLLDALKDSDEPRMPVPAGMAAMSTSEVDPDQFVEGGVPKTRRPRRGRNS